MSSEAVEPEEADSRDSAVKAILTHLDASKLDHDSKSEAKIPEEWCVITSKENREWLNQGNAFFKFGSGTGPQLEEAQKRLVDSIVNRTSFEDETKENGVPNVNVFDDSDGAKYTFILAINSYLLPKVAIDDFRPELLATVEYQTRCVPGSGGSVRIWTAEDYDIPNKTTFRLTRPLVPYVVNITLQLQCSLITSTDALKELSKLAGVPVHRAILMERTKRNIEISDATAKAKVALMYTQIKGGVLVTMATVILNTYIPALVAPWLGKFGSWGAWEAAETAVLTRSYLLKTLLKDRQFKDTFDMSSLSTALSSEEKSAKAKKKKKKKKK